MRTYLILIFSIFIYFTAFSQAPQAFNYQAVVRDASGTALINQSVNFRISILSGSVSGTTEYIETHNGVTNAYGVVLLSIGSGSPTLGTLSGINWGTNSFFIKVEADPAGGTSYLDMGTTQLLSVPYAMYSEKAGNVPVYTGGNGIDVTGTTITNTNPDQAVTMTSGTGISITGSYPSFTVTNSSPNATHTGDVTGTTALTIANGAVTSAKLNSMSATNGQVLKFNGTNWAPATDLNNGTPAGVNKTVQFNNSGSFGGDTAMIWDNTNKRLGVGITNPNGRMVIRGSATAPATEPLFEVKNALGQTVFVVYPDSVHIYVKDSGGAKSNQGGFAVSGRNNSKAVTNNFLTVTPDSTRIFTGDTLSGFGVENLSGSGSTSYMHLTPNNYFIGHQSGENTHLDILNPGYGMHNTFFGYQAGQYNTTGYQNTFIGYQAGQNHLTGAWNLFIGQHAGFNNTDGLSNIFIGKEAGYNNPSGTNNMCIGNQAGYSVNSTSFWNNVFIGNNAGYSMTSGYNNTFVGVGAGGNPTFSDGCTYIGSGAGGFNPNSFNTFVGSNCGIYAALGNKNVYMGYETGTRSYGSHNVLIGYRADYNSFTTYNNSVAIGDSVLLSGSNQVRLGNGSTQTFYCQGAFASTTAVAANMYVSSTGQILRSTSSKRYKKDISDLEINTSDIYKLKPVSYTSINDNKRYFGLIAEDVAEVIPGLAEFTREKDVIKGSNSEKLIPDAVQYPMLSVLLLNEVQKHQKKIIELSIQNENLVKIIEEQKESSKKQSEIISDMQKQINELRSIINK